MTAPKIGFEESWKKAVANKTRHVEEEKFASDLLQKPSEK
jgi:hypothetical protein